MLDYSHDIMITGKFNFKFDSNNKEANVLCDIYAFLTVEVTTKQNAYVDTLFCKQAFCISKSSSRFYRYMFL